MSTTFQELKEMLAHELDEIELLERLNLTSFDLVNTYSDLIETLWQEHKFDDLLEDENVISTDN